MNTKFLFSILFIFAGFFVSAQPVFQKAYGGLSVEGAWCVQQTSDGGYIITAESNTYSAGGDAVYLVKTDSAGVLQWTRTFGGAASYDYGNMVRETFDGGYIITGITYSFGSGQGDMYLIKTDSAGNYLWTKTYGGTSIEEGFSVQQTADSGYVIAGFTQSYGSGSSDVYVVKTGAGGNVQWSHTYGGPGDEGYSGTGNISIHQVNGNGYIVAAYTNSFGAGGYDLYLLRLGAGGGLTWSRTFGGASDEYGFSNNIGQTGDGGFIMVGYTRSFGSGGADVFLLKTNGLGHLVWSKTYGGPAEDYGYAVEQTSDGGYAISGTTHSFGNGSWDAYVIRTDITGNYLWSKAYGGVYEDRGYSIEETADTGLVISGYTKSFGSGNFDVYLVKTDAHGISGCQEVSPPTTVTTPTTIEGTPNTMVSTGCIVTISATLQGVGGSETAVCSGTVGLHTETIQRNRIEIYPNPSNGIFTLDAAMDITQLEVVNVLGEVVLKQTINAAQTHLNLSAYPDGIYFVRCIRENNVVATEKIVVTGE